jgi:hypothetical protein
LIGACAEQYARGMRRAGTLAAVLLFVAGAHAGLAPEVDKALRDATYVYVQSERKTGEWSKPAEIWFHYEDGKVYVATRPTSWRVRRIGWKRTKARIAVGKADGPAFEARGQLVKDTDLQARLMADYAKKYPDGWAKYEKAFQDGFKSGDRVVVRYTPE